MILVCMYAVCRNMFFLFITVAFMFSGSMELGEAGFQNTTILNCDVSFDYIYLNVSYYNCYRDPGNPLHYTTNVILSIKKISERNRPWEDTTHCSMYTNHYSCYDSVHCKVFHVNDHNRYSVSVLSKGDNNDDHRQVVPNKIIPKNYAFHCYKEHGAINFTIDYVNTIEVNVKWSYHSYDEWFNHKAMLKAYKKNNITHQKECKRLKQSGDHRCKISNLQHCQEYNVCLETTYILSAVPKHMVCQKVNTTSEILSVPIPVQSNNTKDGLVSWTISDDWAEKNWYFKYQFLPWEEEYFTSNTSVQCTMDSTAVVVYSCNACACSKGRYINCPRQFIEEPETRQSNNNKVFVEKTTLIITVLIVSVLLLCIIIATIVYCIRNRTPNARRQGGQNDKHYISPRLDISHHYETIDDIRRHSDNDR